MKITTNFINRIKRHEGYKKRPYRCSMGKLTIGYGRNLDDKGLLEQEAEFLLFKDVEEARIETTKAFDFFETLSQTRQEVLVEMAFNMGIKKLKRFKKMIDALKKQNFKEASVQMLDSLWAKQVKSRAQTLALLMEQGQENAKKENKCS